MAQSHVLSALYKKRGRIAGEMQIAERALAKKRRELDTIDATINLFSPQTNPDLIPAIRPYSRSLFFDYGELVRLCYEALRKADGPMTTGRIADYAIQAKGLDVDRATRKGIVDIVRKGLGRLEARGRVRRVIVEPETWWELAG